MKDKLSALLDGDLDEQSARPVFDSLRRDASLRRDWDAYCTIGDVLRGEGAGSPDMLKRVMATIEVEPTLLAPQPRTEETASGSRAWRALMPIAASVMGVAAVGLVASSIYSGSEPVAQVASVVERAHIADSAPVRPVAVTVDVEDPHREYVFAHQAMTGGGPIPGAVQYIRSVSVAGQDGGR